MIAMTRWDRFKRAVTHVWAGVAGATLVCVGLGMIYVPAGVIAAGVFLLLLDYRRA